MDLSKLYQTQISLTEWLSNIAHSDTEAHRKEDNDKRERLAVLNDITGIPFDRPTQFPASDIADRTPRFDDFLASRGHELCALRLIPLESDLPKLRTRGASIRDSLNWFSQQNIEPAKYKADFVPHPGDHIWSTIVVVNQHGIFGEIVADSHNVLTQGFHTTAKPITFAYDFANWELSEDDDAALMHLKEIAAALHIADTAKRSEITEKLNGTFANNYLCGYFETVQSKEFGTWFIDYNRLLGAMFEDVRIAVHKPGTSLRGQTGSPGCSTGRARVRKASDVAAATINGGDILVTDMTSPQCLPLMQRASAIVTEQGGILSHAAITCRELKKPCIIGVRNLFEHIKDGDLIRIDADNGTIEKLA